MARKSQPPKPGIWKILWPLLFPFGTDDEWEKGTMPKWRQTVGAFWVGSVFVPIAALAFLGHSHQLSPLDRRLKYARRTRSNLLSKFALLTYGLLIASFISQQSIHPVAWRGFRDCYLLTFKLFLGCVCFCLLSFTHNLEACADSG